MALAGRVPRVSYRVPVYRPFDSDPPGVEVPGLYGIGCSACGASNGWVELVYADDGRIFGASVELDRRLDELGVHGELGLPRFGRPKRLNKHEARGRPSPDPVLRAWESLERVQSTDTGAPSRVWLHCLKCRSGHLVDPVAQVVPSP